MRPTAACRTTGASILPGKSRLRLVGACKGTALSGQARGGPAAPVRGGGSGFTGDVPCRSAALPLSPRVWGRCWVSPSHPQPPTTPGPYGVPRPHCGAKGGVGKTPTVPPCLTPPCICSPARQGCRGDPAPACPTAQPPRGRFRELPRSPTGSRRELCQQQRGAQPRLHKVR